MHPDDGMPFGKYDQRLRHERSTGDAAGGSTELPEGWQI
jgi:hypothetical protein